MTTGIIIYSQSGNTLQAARRLMEALQKKGHGAEILQIKTQSEQPQMKKDTIQFIESPSPEAFDRLVFASPVWAFTLCGVMKLYLKGLPGLSGKPVSLFVTQALPFHWLGASKALQQMKALCLQKGAEVTATAAVSWSAKRREGDLLNMVETLTRDSLS